MSGIDITTPGRQTLRRRRRLAHLLADNEVPALARAYDVDAAGHLVAEIVPRVTLEDLCRFSPLPPAAALDALRDVAGELHAMALERGEAHGDVKPWNIFVLPDGHATVADPHALEPADAPRPQGATRRGDAYWFAVLACELLTGTRPIDRADAAALMDRTPGFPVVARAAVLLGLRPRPEQRCLPHRLVAALDAVPASSWSPQRPPTVDPLPEGPATAAEPAAVVEVVEAPPDDPASADPAVVVPDVAIPGVQLRPEPQPEPEPEPEREPAPEPAATPPTRSRRPFFRRIGPWVSGLGVLLVVAGAAGGAWLLRPTNAEGVATAVGIRQVLLDVTPPQTHCPLARVHLSTTILTDGSPGTLTVRWQLPGAALPQRTVVVAEGQRKVRLAADVAVTGHRAVAGRAVVTVVATDARATTPFRFDCGSEGRRTTTA